ncbi:beta-ketoacyl synthase N-terminal-like domain-containing protein [Micromonospora sp. NPDC049044]|uniref:beta-ketoacyl synthase N-terminal-like domain-containing protein n=1 Tax=unclassified Micromonospora TaxID=2617518 RepID=UPI0033C4C391
MSGDVVLTGSASLVSPETAPSDGAAGWFDPAEHLGARGWKYLTPATRFLLATAQLAMADAKLDPATMAPESMGVAVGTNFAADPVVGRLDQTVRTEGAHWLSPAEAPNFSVNLAASHVSMRWAMRAFNLTLTNPMVAGIDAVLTMAGAIRRGRARLGLAGATEERPTAYRPGGGMAGEGACCLVLESRQTAIERGATPLATVAGGFSRFHGRPPEDDGTPWVIVPADAPYLTLAPLLAALDLLAVHGRATVVASSPHGNLAALTLSDR